MISENGIWEIGIHPVLFGFRVRAGRVGEMEVAMDYCAADQHEFLMELYAMAIILLQTYPEETSTAELRADLPGYEVRPINRDPCWENLKELVREKLQVPASAAGAA